MNNRIYIFTHELQRLFKDQGLMLFVILLPLAYPIIYSWIYNNEVVREVPVVVVDQDNSAQSREFIRLYDAAPEVNVAYRAGSISEAQAIVDRQDAFGIIYFPADFSTRLNRMEQATVGVYCDMSLMLAYKNVFSTATAIQGIMGRQIQTKLLGNTTDRQDEISTQPMVVDEIPIFNTTGGYGNFVLPAVLVLILQQTLLMAMGLTVGTNREHYGKLMSHNPEYNKVWAPGVITMRTLAYLLVYALTSSYVLLVVPRLFHFTSILYAWDYVCFVVPYILACIFFSMTMMSVILQREDVLLIVVFTSVPLLFLSGISWPGSDIPTFWRYVSCAFPSTFGIRAFVRMNSMGARLDDVYPEIICLWLQVAFYFVTTNIIYRKGRNISG